MPWLMARLEDVHPIFCHARSDRCLAAKHMGTRMSARADVIVLGAGIVGVSVALHLQKRDRDVVLIDRQEAGEETSYGNAGLIQREAVIPYTPDARKSPKPISSSALSIPRGAANRSPSASTRTVGRSGLHDGGVGRVARA